MQKPCTDNTDIADYAATLGNIASFGMLSNAYQTNINNQAMK